MFKFNFSSPADQNDETKIDSTPDSDHSVTNDNVLVAHEVQLSENHRKNAEAAEISLLTITNCSFRHVNLKQVEELICSENSSIISDALKVNSDVVKGVYEGGLKLWECTLDLIEYIIKENLNFNGLKVLDLGCGSGMLGIITLLRQASAVHFQDYNAEVLDYITIPNVLLNKETSHEVEMKFFAGDWGCLPSLLDTYDVILTSETIYNPENYSKLEKVMDSSLKENGCIYLAAKVTYFGVGGDIRQFEKFLKTKKWKYETVFQTQEGVRREVIKITRM